MGVPQSRLMPADRLHEELARREHELAVLKETADMLAGERNLETLLQLIARRARELVDASTVLIPVLDKECTTYTYMAGDGENAEEIVGESLPIEFGICGWVWKHKKPWWRGVLDDLDEHERTLWESEAGTVLLVPLIGKEHFLGGVSALRKRNGEEFTRRDLDLLTLFASQAALAIENALAFERLDEALRKSEDLRVELLRLNADLLESNRQLEYLSLYDPITRLPNRALFHDRIDSLCTRSGDESGERELGLILLDILHFREINERWGNEAGDHLLRDIAERLRMCMQPGDTIARYGADEFVFLRPDIGREETLAFAEFLLEQLASPFTWGGETYTVVVHAGVAHGQADEESVRRLPSQAQMALGHGRSNRRPITCFDPAMEAESATSPFTLIGELRLAFQEEQFLLHYQPKIALNTGRVVGCEALVRWNHPELGLVYPDRFLTALDETGLMAEFNRWLIRTARAQCERWKSAGLEVQVAVNLPVSSLLDADFIDWLTDEILVPTTVGCFVIEITETVFLSDYKRIKKIMDRLVDAGVLFSIDDFGTGHSSLSRLRSLPVHEIKIDRSFVMEMDRNQEDAVIVRSIVELGRNLGLKVVAEGVENDVAARQLAVLGCDFAQGYHYCRPVPAEEFVACCRKCDSKGGC